jgi:hypothetical protein
VRSVCDPRVHAWPHMAAASGCIWLAKQRLSQAQASLFPR